jgi:hypothetical protein
MTYFIECFADEIEKLATPEDSQNSFDLARSQKAEDGTHDSGSTYRPKIGIGKLGPAVGGPLLADPSKYPFNRLAP